MKKLFLIGLIALAGCNNDYVHNSSNKISKEDSIYNMYGPITYFKDTRTGLCFASILSRNSYGGIVSITTVPCDSVKKFLK